MTELANKRVSLCVLGSINLDMIIQTKTLPRAGETVANGHFSSLPGGKGANIALAAKRLGADVTLVGSVGKDDYAGQALALLREAGVDLSGLIENPDHHTGLAFINVASDGENQIAVASGANAAFSPKDVPPIKAGGLVTQFEIPMDTIITALQRFDGFVCVNASPVTDGLEALLPFTDLVIVNEGEFEGYKDTLSKFNGLVAITFGSEGARLVKQGQELAQALPPNVKVVDTTGAGDSFAAALTVALLEGQPYEAALTFACAVGALTATKIGTQTAAPQRDTVDAILA